MSETPIITDVGTSRRENSPAEAPTCAAGVLNCRSIVSEGCFATASLLDENIIEQLHPLVTFIVSHIGIDVERAGITAAAGLQVGLLGRHFRMRRQIIGLLIDAL